MKPDYRPQLEKFRTLKWSWDGWGGLPTAQTACDTLIRIAEQFPEEYPPYGISPRSLGGILVEWREKEFDATLCISHTGEIECYVEDGEDRNLYGEDKNLFWTGEVGLKEFIAYLQERLNFAHSKKNTK